jgi:phosphoserine phosphatase
VQKLQAQGKAVFLVSGGFRQIIHPIAKGLNIPVPDNVYANNLLFNVSTLVGWLTIFRECSYCCMCMLEVS